MRKILKSVISLSMAALVAVQSISPVAAMAAEQNRTAIVEDAGILVRGVQALDHLIINQVYGGGGKGSTPIKNGFIEIYNPTGQDVNLNGYVLTYGNNSLNLSDVTLGTGKSWLVVCSEEQTTDDFLTYDLPDADQTWDQELANKDFTISLKKQVSDTSEVVDVDTATSNSAVDNLKTSKQKSLRRVNYSDTDSDEDWEVIIWEKASVTVTDDYINQYAPRNSKGEMGNVHGASSDPVYEPVEASDEKIKGVQNSDTTLDMELYARYNSGAKNPDGGSVEIVEYNENNGYAYAVSGMKGKIIATKISGVENKDTVTDLTGTEYDVKTLVEAAGVGDFVYGDITSVAISPDGTKLAAAVQHNDYDKAGKIAVFTCNQDGSLSDAQLYEAGIQPDMVTFADAETVLTADEGEPRNGYTQGNVDPAGTVTILDLSTGTSEQAGFEEFTADELVAKNILIGKVNGELLAPETDLEPEYIAVTADGNKAYVSLQEANAIAVLDIKEKKFTDIHSVGFEDYSKVAVDIVEDSKYEPATYDNLAGARMPDGIALYENAGKTYLVTANEGDAREWGDYNNEAKTSDFTGNKIRIINPELCGGLPEGKSVMFGGRGFTIFEVTENGISEIYDSGNDFEAITAEAYPEYFNCSNADIKTDSRSGKKGPEPENVTVGQIGDRTYAFVAVERVGGIMAYDITNPEYSMYVNYINSRDFSADIKGDVSPEGLCFIPKDDKSAVLLTACEVSGTMAAYELTKQEADDIIILYTNDVHNAYEKSDDCIGYASAAQYKKQLESLGYEVELADIGDALQGDIIGTLSKGSYIADIMEKTGYTIAVPGNHEFDFGMDNFLSLAKQTEYKYLSANFMDLRTQESVLEPYTIVSYDENTKVAYIGLTTPETFTKSTPTYFQDENGNYIYGFCEGNQGKELYEKVQETVNAVKEAGADYVVVMGHIGTDVSSSPWTSKEIIANTTGIDVFLDGHSHSTIPSEICRDKNGEDVLLTSSGTKLSSLGELKIHKDGTMSSKLVKNISMQDAETLAFVNDISNQFGQLKNQKVAESDVELTIKDTVSGNRLVRSQETNLGDLCADAYRTLLGADIAFVNGGGVRDNIKAGDITYGDIIKVHPFGNAACLIEANGQEIIDALELGARSAGVGENGGFLQVSGLTYEIDTRIPSTVKLDDKGMFVEVTGERRVRNVKVNGEPIDLNKTYKLASHNYMLKSSGDGYSMFADNKILQDEVLIDNQVLINYIVNTLGGKIAADSIYSKPYGEGRIRVITDEKLPDCETNGSMTILQGDGTEVIPISALGHTVVTDKAVAATCTKAGKTEGSHCSVCNKVLVAQKTVAALGHNYVTTVQKATTKANGKIVKKCSRCDVSSTTTIASIKSVSLSKTIYTYDGKAKKPTVTVLDSNGKRIYSRYYTVTYKSNVKVGKGTVVITFKGNYSGTIVKPFTIKPAKADIVSLTGGKNSVSMKWKKQSGQISGFMIQYSTDRNFSSGSRKSVTITNKNKLSSSFKNLKQNKKYYVRIRTYKYVTVNGKSVPLYSDWSKVQTVTTK